MTPMSTCVLGVDAGATKTVCALGDSRGCALGMVRTEGLNLQTTPRAVFVDRLRTIVTEALALSPGASPGAVCLGVAGADREADFSAIRTIVGSLGLTVPTIVVNDAVIALVAGIGDDPGVVIVAGTGSIAYGRNSSNRAARAGGWGYILGDEGSGYWLGRRALRAVVRELDGRGPTTRLTPRILNHFGITTAAELIRHIQGTDVRPAVVAALAAHVQEAFAESDAVAARILDSAATELAASARAVVGRLSMQDTSFACVLAGTIFRAMPSLVEALNGAIVRDAPRARVTRLLKEPAEGALHLAAAALSGPVPLPHY